MVSGTTEPPNRKRYVETRTTISRIEGDKVLCVCVCACRRGDLEFKGHDEAC